MDTPLISIVVPVYNVERWLVRCLDSIAAQNYTHIDVILVDDGSTDTSGSICDNYCLKDSRFRVIHQENKWLSGARNTGLDAAKGDYVCFVDSDDYVSPEYVSALYEGILGGADLSMVGFDLVNEDGVALDYSGDCPLNTKDFSGEECLIRMINGQGCGYSYGVAWNKLYPMELIGSRRFKPYYSLEDFPFNFDVFSRAGTIHYRAVKAYHYLQRPDSIMGAKETFPKMAYNRFAALTDICSSISRDENLIRGLMMRKVFSTTSLMYRDACGGTEYEKPIKEVFSKVWKQNGREYLRCDMLPLKERLLMALAWNSPSFWEFYNKKKHN